MGPKPTPSKQGNTLFSYFNKSPAPSRSQQSQKPNSQDVLSPRKSPNESKGKTSGNVAAKKDDGIQLSF